MGARAGLVWSAENLAPLGFDPRTVQPVASRYTNYAIRPLAGFMAFPYSSQKLTSSGEECMFVSMFTFRMSFHTMAVKLPFTLVIRSPLFIFILSLNSSASHFYWSDSPTTVYCFSL